MGSYGASRLWNVERLQDGGDSETSVREERFLRRVAMVVEEPDAGGYKEDLQFVEGDQRRG